MNQQRTFLSVAIFLRQAEYQEQDLRLDNVAGAALKTELADMSFVLFCEPGWGRGGIGLEIFAPEIEANWAPTFKCCFASMGCERLQVMYLSIDMLQGVPNLNVNKT